MTNPPAIPETSKRPRNRWGVVGRWLLGIVVALVLIAGVAVVALLQMSASGQLSEPALRFTNRLLARTLNLDLGARRVQRTPSGARLEEVSLSVVEPGRRTRLLFSRQVDVGVDPWALLRRRGQIYTLRVQEPVFTLTIDSTGHPILPALRPRRGPAKPPKDGIQVELIDARFEVRDRHGDVRWLERGAILARLVPAGDGYEIELERGTGRLPPLGLVVESAEGAARTNAPGIELRSLHAVTDAGAITLSGALVDSTWNAQLAASRWPWEFFGELLEQPALSVPGHLDVQARLAGTLRRAGFEANVEGRWRDEPISAAVTGRIGSDGVFFDEASARWRETAWRGRGEFARSGAWRFGGRLDRLDLARVERLVPDVVLPPSKISGFAEIAGGSARLRVSTRDLAGELRGIAFTGLSGEWRLEGKRHEVRGEGSVAGGRAHAAGWWNEAQVSIEGRGEDFAIESVLRAAGYGGEASGTIRSATLRLDGAKANPAFHAEGIAGDAEVGGVAVDSIHASADGRIGGVTDVALGASAFGATGYGWRADTVKVSGSYAGSRLRLPEIYAVHDDTVLTASLAAERNGQGWSYTIWPAVLRTADWRIAASSPLRVSSGTDGWTFEDVRVAGDAGRFQLNGRVRAATDLELRIAASDVDLAPLGRLGGRNLEGTIRGTARLVAHGANREAEVDVQALDLVSEGTRLDSASVRLAARAEGPSLTLNTLHVAVPGGVLDGEGTAELADPQWPALPTQWPQLLDRIRSWRGTIETRNLDLSLIAAVEPNVRGLTGRATLRLEVGGTPSSPEARLDGLVAEPAYSGYYFDQGEWRVRLAGGAVSFEPFELRRENRVYRLTGSMPFAALWTVPESPEGESDEIAERRPDPPSVPYDLRIEVPDGDLRFLPLLLPQIAAAEGRVHADLRISGSAPKPTIHGRLGIEDARMRVSGREEVYEDIDVAAALVDTALVIESASARQGQNGHLTANGRISLDGLRIRGFDLDVVASRATVIASGEYVFEFDGTLHIGTGPLIGDAWMPLPRITGEMEVREGLVLYDFADPSNRVYFAGPERAPPWVYHLDVTAPALVFWRSPTADIEVEAELTLEQTLTYFSVLGTIESRRGSYYFLGNKLVVDRGKLEFDSVEPMNPTIDASLSTEVATGAGGRTSLGRETITITLAERVREPEVTITSSSGLSEQEIFRLLTVGRYTGEGLSDRDRSVLLTTTGTQYLVRQLASQFPEAAGVFRDLEIGSAVVEDETETVVVPTLGFSRYFTSDLRLGYSQVVGGGATRDLDLPFRSVRAEYRLSKVFYLTGEMIEHRLGSNSLPGTQRSEVEFGADVRARHEY